MTKNKAWFTTLVLTFLVACTGGSQQHAEERMQEVPDRVIARFDVRGVSAAVIMSDQTWTGVSGISHDTVSIPTPSIDFIIHRLIRKALRAVNGNGLIP